MDKEQNKQEVDVDSFIEEEDTWDGGPFPDLCEQFGVDEIYVGEGMWWDNIQKRLIDKSEN